MFLRMKNWFRSLNPSYQDQMMAYLNQANDRVHLEQLEREWFKKHRL
jgi:hypothetical protein